MLKFNGQAEQDKFVYNVLKGKQNGFFVEIGSGDPIDINNSYLLQLLLGWKGIMIEYCGFWLDRYKHYRPNSIHVVQDATTIDYKQLFQNNNVPKEIDYLQIDLEVGNGSTLKTLMKLEQEVMKDYRMRCITFEHDIYTSNFMDTRKVSREIFKRNGYYCVFEDIENGGNPYEDWYVDPNLVDMNYVKELQEKNKKNYYPHKITGVTLDWKKIEY